MKVNRYSFDSGVTTQWIDNQIKLSPCALDQMRQTLEEWLAAIESEPTYWQQTYDAPAPMVRFDLLLDQDGDSVSLVCEIENRPGGVALTRDLNPQFQSNLASLKRRWPVFAGVVEDGRPSDLPRWTRGTVSAARAIKDRILSGHH